VNWNTLNYVIEIAEQGSFSKAAQKLYVAQPSLSQSIKALEKEIGTPIFDRSKSPVTLTYAGELFVRWAKDTLYSREETIRQISDVGGGVKTRLIVGVSFSRSAYPFPSILARFRQLRPNCTIVLVEQTTNVLLEMDDLDLFVGVMNDEHINTTSVMLTEERILLAVPKCYQLEIKRYQDGFPVVNISDFSKKPFIVLSEGQMLRKMCTSLCAREGFYPEIALECRSIQTANAMVEAGIGVTLVPELFVKHSAGDRANYCIIENQAVVRKIAVSYRNDRYLTQDARILIDLLKEMI